MAVADRGKGRDDDIPRRSGKVKDVGGEVFDKALNEPEVNPTASTNAFNAICHRCPTCNRIGVARKSKTHVVSCSCGKVFTVIVGNVLQQLVPEAAQEPVSVGT